MKILVVGNYFYPEHIGGVEIVTYNLVKQYRELGHQVRWVAADVPPRFRNGQRDDAPVRAWNFSEKQFGIPFPIPFPDVIARLYPSARWCDVVHLHDCLYPITVLSLLLAKLAGKAILVTQHTQLIPYESRLKTGIQALAMHTVGKAVHQFADHSVFISENTRDHLPFIAKRIKNSAVIQNGVDTEFFQPLPPESRMRMRKDITGVDDKPIVLFVGRLVAIKGIQFLIPLIEAHQEWHWLIVGRPDEFDPSQWKFPNVTFRASLGLEEIRDAYSVADLSVHPSEVVGMSLTILECMACGTPVVLNESVLYKLPDEDLDYFVRVKANTGQIERALISLLNNRDLLNAYARRAREYAVKQADWRIVATKYLAILEKVSKIA
ncbi:MAG: glycosyltransferase family 4 protein [Anaerolineales bacterium]|nr:glycosyltransferase family 4 protein [Anaerolineales bacterium]